MLQSALLCGEALLTVSAGSLWVHGCAPALLFAAVSAYLFNNMPISLPACCGGLKRGVGACWKSSEVKPVLS